MLQRLRHLKTDTKISDIDIDSQTTNLNVKINEISSSLLDTSTLPVDIQTINGNNVQTNSGVSNSGVLRTVLTNGYESTTTTNISQYGGSAVTIGQQDSSNCIPVVLSSNQPPTGYDRLKIANPHVIFNENFIWSSNQTPRNWSIEESLGSGFSITFNNPRKCLFVSNTLNTAGTYNLYTKQRFRFSGIANQMFLTIKPNISFGNGNTSDESIDITLIEKETENHYIALRISGDGNHSILYSGNGSSTSVSKVSWNLNTDIQSDLLEPCTFYFEFNDNVIRIGEVFEGNIIYFHEIFINSTSLFPYFQIFNVELGFSSGSSSPEYTSNFYGVKLVREYEHYHPQSKFSFIPTTILLALVLGSTYALTGIRYKSTASTTTVPTSLLSFSVCINGAGPNVTGIVSLVRDPTIAGVASWSNYSSTSVVQVLTGAATNTVTNGEYIMSRPFNSSNLAFFFSVDFNDCCGNLNAGEELIVVVHAISSINLVSAIEWIEG